MRSPVDLYRDLVRTAPYQPATNYWRAVELDAVQQHGLPLGRGLDLGCGDGKLTKILIDALDDKRRTWVGIDPDPSETSIARNVGVYAQVHTCPGDDIPEEGATFDFAFSNSVLEHIPDLEPVIAEIARVLRQNGRFIFTVPADTFHDCLGGPPFGGKTERYLASIDRRCAHVRYWSLGDWRSCLSRHGLEIRAHDTYLSRKQSRRWEILSNLTGGLLYKLGGARMRPIEIQRKLSMRANSIGPVGRVVSIFSQALLAGAAPEARTGAAPHACILIDAVKQ